MRCKQLWVDFKDLTNAHAGILKTFDRNFGCELVEVKLHDKKKLMSPEIGLTMRKNRREDT